MTDLRVDLYGVQVGTLTGDRDRDRFDFVAHRDGLERFGLGSQVMSIPDSAARVSLAGSVGCVAFLVGPPALGFLGEELGLRAALVVPLLCLIAAAVVAPMTRAPSVQEPGTLSSSEEARSK